MTRSEFISSYIQRLEAILQEYTESLCDEDAVFNCIREIYGVFAVEIPQINDVVWGNNGAQTIANVVIGILKLHIINSAEEAVRMYNNASMKKNDTSESASPSSF